jgi:chloramphenicol-sensitive protein RarD
VNPRPTSSFQTGIAAALGAYVLWGLVPLYFKALGPVPPDEVLAHRILWSGLVLAALATIGRKWRDIASCLRDPTTRWLLTGSTILIGLNWYLYIYSVFASRVMESSLGYFINPLLNVLLGMIFFKERLRIAQWLALALAAFSVVMLGWGGAFPWLAIALAGTFASYGLLRKKAGVNSVTGLSVETLSLLPIALLWIAQGQARGVAFFGLQGWTADLLLVSSGLVTTIPLLCFGTATRLLPLSTLGFLQYISPTLQFLVAVWVFGEPLDRYRLAWFICIWIALAVFSVDSVIAYRRQANRLQRTETPAGKETTITAEANAE